MNSELCFGFFLNLTFPAMGVESALNPTPVTFRKPNGYFLKDRPHIEECIIFIFPFGNLIQKQGENKKETQLPSSVRDMVEAEGSRHVIIGNWDPPFDLMFISC